MGSLFKFFNNGLKYLIRHFNTEAAIYYFIKTIFFIEDCDPASSL